MPADPGPIDRYNRKVLYLDREFQEYSLQHEIYLAPIDLDEETRLRDQHEMLKMIYQDWNNSLYPRVVGDPEKILELGFGSGEWAFELAEYDPDCTIANLNEPFEFDEPESFDLVHSRFVASGIAATRATDTDILTVEEFDSLVAAACEELADVNARPYIRLYTVYGMKP
ncbi:hypothetical protein B0A52_03588 [Exophiala mesophila]|uniref:Methyltransferase domain-containing protein n=1 Tax=Exophiala mesophila TaxID=212818 RepID=A0A438N9X7_EXOME|nr:hypothetical protein B0A52_03588 [Exophiala mesophila]